MINKDWEKELRALPTAPPPAELRGKIFARLPKRKPVWHRPLAYALCLMLLLAVNLGLQHFQEARLNRLMGNGSASRMTSKPNPEMLLAYLQNRNQIYHLSTEEMP
jgi:hypothetical protein